MFTKTLFILLSKPAHIFDKSQDLLTGRHSCTPNYEIYLYQDIAVRIPVWRDNRINDVVPILPRINHTFGRTSDHTKSLIYRQQGVSSFSQFKRPIHP